MTIRATLNGGSETQGRLFVDPNPAVPPEKLEAQRNNLHYIDPDDPPHVKDHLESRNAVTSKMREAAVAPTRSRHKLADVPSILEHGMLTQHSTGVSNGSYAPEERRETEGRLFYDHTEPVYGYQGTPISERAASAYGDARFTMKEHMRPHTTITNRDSLGWHDPDGLDLTDLQDAAGMSSQYDGGADLSRSYVEAQIHRTPEARDIQSLDLNVTEHVQNRKELEQSQKVLDMTRRSEKVTGVDKTRHSAIPNMMDRLDARKDMFQYREQEIGLALNAGHAHGVPTRITKDETHSQERFNFADVPQSEYPLFADTDHMTFLDVPQSPDWVNKNLGSQFTVGPHTGSSSKAPVVYTGPESTNRSRIVPDLNLPLDSVPGWDDDY